jgi:hypothetical protein
MEDFLNDEWRAALAHNGLDDFDRLWGLQLPWFEAPNQRRGGWSGVSRYEFVGAAGERRCVFLKRQENHKTFSWRHPLKGIPTFLREFRLILRYRAKDIPSLEPVYFAMRDCAGGHRAILATAELQGFAPLDGYVAAWERTGRPAGALRRKLLRAVAMLTRQLHAGHIQHNCYYPKHVFVRIGADDAVEARVIDLEKSRWRPFSIFCTLRDLDTLNRHSAEWRRGERLLFLKAYLGIERLTPYAKWLWRRLAARAAQKSAD